MKINKRKELLNLVRKYLNGTASKKEKGFVEKYYRFFDHKEALSANLSEEERQAIERRILENIHKEMEPKLNKPVTLIFQDVYIRVGVAIAVVFLMIGLSFWLIRPQSGPKWTNSKTNVHDINPGENKAVLTLADGSTIKLNRVQRGLLFKHGSMEIIKQDSGRLLYRFGQKNKDRKDTEVYNEAFNILSTPVSGSYQIVLSDGSKVWLNASSSLKFPVTFHGKMRKVVVRGEAYFEVKGDDAHPFIVQIEASGGQNMGSARVLGTHFNINAYMDDQIVRTTLVEGKVKITKDGLQELLKPGEQGLLEQGENKIGITKVNIKEAIAWKNGFFLFDNTDLVSIMNQISRWYDVKVVYNNRPEGRYSGVISRHTKLSEVLEILEAGGAHFKVMGKKVIVNP